MSGKYKAYPEYHWPLVEWFGEVPEGWIVTTLKNGYNLWWIQMSYRNL